MSVPPRQTAGDGAVYAQRQHPELHITASHQSPETSREPLAADDRQPDDGVVTRIRGADAAEVGDPAEAGVAADQRQEPLLLPHLVAVEVRPLLPRPPSAARSDAHVDVGRDTDD